MKSLHRADLFGWDAFDRARNVDFNAVLWRRAGGNVVVDPMPLDEHDRAHLVELGGVAIVVVTNSDHTRAAAAIASEFGATLVGPAQERDTFPFACDRWVSDGDEVAPNLVAFEVKGSKTPGELALLLEDTTLITGDLIRAHRAGQLMLLPDAKLTDKALAIASVVRLAALPDIGAVLVGDGFSAWNDGKALLRALASALSAG